MQISVVTVCFNGAATIGETLRTVAAQIAPHVEHIVVDGGSSDGTVELAKSLGRPGIVVVSERDNGIYDAMNKGIRLATGDVVGFLNADDFYADATALARVAQVFQHHPECQAVLGDVEYVHPKRLDVPIRRYRSTQFAPDRIGWGWMPAHPGVFLRREWYVRLGGFKTTYRIAADFEFIARLFTTEPHLSFQYLPEVLVRMRTGGVSTAGIASTILLNREVMRACRENGVATNWFKLLSKYPAKIAEYAR